MFYLRLLTGGNLHQSQVMGPKFDNTFHNFTPSHVIIELILIKSKQRGLLPTNMTLPHGSTFGQLQKKAPKIKIEFDDNSGTKYSFSVEGGLSKDKMAKMMEFIEQISSGNQPLHQQNSPSPDYSNIDTNFARLYGLLQGKFKFGSFTSSDVLEAYLHEFDIPSTLSTMSTYLARLTERGVLTRMRNGSGWVYKLMRVIPQEEVTSTVQTVEQTSRQDSFILTP
jgi:hypothetical protein